MLFLLKRRWATALPALVLLASIGVLGRRLLPAPPPIDFTPCHVLLGIGVFCGILASDMVLHTLLLLTFRKSYRTRYRELAALFRGQTIPAILSGAVLAGIGEEMAFRGMSTSALYLLPGAALFGLLHHIRPSLWIFTPWAIYQGLLLAGALYVTDSLAVNMVAHFCHDLAGFLIFRRLNQRPTGMERLS